MTAHLDGEVERVVQRGLPLLVLLLELRDGGGGVVADAGGLPAAVVARRVRLVQLVAELPVPPHVEDGDAEGPLPAVLGVGLLDVAKPGHQLLAGHGLPVLVVVPLPDEPELVGEHVGVGGDAGHRAGHVLVEVVDLLRVEDLVQQLVGVPPLGGQDHPVGGQDAQAGAGVADGLHGVLHLVEAALGGEDGGAGVVAAGHGD